MSLQFVCRAAYYRIPRDSLRGALDISTGALLFGETVIELTVPKRRSRCCDHGAGRTERRRSERFESGVASLSLKRRCARQDEEGEGFIGD